MCFPARLPRAAQVCQGLPGQGCLLPHLAFPTLAKQAIATDRGHAFSHVLKFPGGLCVLWLCLASKQKQIDNPSPLPSQCQILNKTSSGDLLPTQTARLASCPLISRQISKSYVSLASRPKCALETFQISCLFCYQLSPSCALGNKISRWPYRLNKESGHSSLRDIQGPSTLFFPR